MSFFLILILFFGFPFDTSGGKEPVCQCVRHRKQEFSPWVRKIPWRRAWQLTPVCLPRESHGQRSLADYSLWDLKVSDTTEATKHVHQLLHLPTHIKKGGFWCQAFPKLCILYDIHGKHL